MGVVLGVASLVVVLAVTSGFEHEFQDKGPGGERAPYCDFLCLERDMAEAERDAQVIKRPWRACLGWSACPPQLHRRGIMIGKVGANLKGVDLSDGAPEAGAGSWWRALSLTWDGAHCAEEQPSPDPAAAESSGADHSGQRAGPRLHSHVGECLQVLVPFSGGIDSAPSAYTFRVVGISSLGFTNTTRAWPISLGGRAPHGQRAPVDFRS